MADLISEAVPRSRLLKIRTADNYCFHFSYLEMYLQLLNIIH